MKSIKALLTLVLACILALGLFACAAEEEKEQVQKTPLAVAQSDPLSYYNTLVGLLQDAEGFVMEIGYGMDDIEPGNGTLKEAKDLIKGYIIDYIKDSVTYSKKPRKDEQAISNAAGRCPALFNALLPGDLLEALEVNEVLDLQVAEKLKQLEEDIANGLVSRLMNAEGKTLKDEDGKIVKAEDATDEQKRIHVLGQMSENAVTEASGLFQIDGKLTPAAAEKLFTPADKADILAQLAKAEGYLLVEDYALEPTEFTLYVQAHKIFVDADQAAAQQVSDPAQAGDLLKELRLELKASLTATARGTGAFAGGGEFPITLTLKKTVKYKDILWPAPEEDA